VQMNLDLGWTLEDEPSIPFDDDVREALVRLMTAAIVAVSTRPKEVDDDAEQRASEDRH